jgi:CubicO group peptidase (beta-lactamase class C family)
MKRQKTKSYPFFNRLGFSLVALALALAVLQQFRPSRANALPALAAAATPQPRTDFDIFPLNSTGVVQAKSGGADWSGTVPGYNIVRTFENINNQSHIIMLNGNTGKGRTYRLDAAGSLGVLTWETGDNVISDLRCTSAETVKIGTTTYLITHDSFTGKIRTFHFYNNGQPNFGSMGVTTLSDWKDKNLFSLYYYNGAYYLLGVDTWTGNAVAYSINGQKIGENDWTRGWTSVDHLAVGGVTYRLLYKAAGDPHKKPLEANDQLARFVIQKVNADGVSGQKIYDSPYNADFSSVRFAPLFNGQNWEWHIFFFNRDTRVYIVRRFDKQNGLGAITAFGLIKDGPQFNDPLAPAYVDIEPYTIGVKTFLAAVSDDNTKPFYFGQAEKMGQAIHDGLKNRVVGYQFMLAQSGRIIYSRAHGKRYLSADAGVNAASNSYDMTTRTSNGLASVSKMIMTMTALKLADNGVVQNIEQDPIANYLDPAKYPSGQLHNWVKQRPVINLLTHTSGLNDKKGGVCNKLDGDKMDCADFFATAPQLECDGAGRNCERNYNNYNTNAARVVIESLTGAETAGQIVNKTRELWADSVGLSGLTCEINPNLRFFAPCNGAADCFDYNGQSWRQSDYEQAWSSSCSAGGWWASSRELLELMTAIRYRKILSSSKLNDLLVSTTMKDVSGNKGSTALGWEKPWDAGDEMVLGKNGSTTNEDGFGPRAYITRLPNNCDAVIVTNTPTSDHPQGLLTDAYLYAAGVNGAPPVFYDIAVNGSELGGRIYGVIAANTVKTSASKNQHVTAYADGNSSLKLAAWSVSPDIGQVEFVDSRVASTPDNALNIPVTDVSITDGVDFATAARGSTDGQLKVIAWRFNGSQITQHGTGYGGLVYETSITKAAGQGAQGRVVTAVRTAAGQLQMKVWDFNNSTDTVTLRDTYTAGLISDVAIKTLRFSAGLGQSSRIVTAVRNGSNQLQVDVWDVDGNGQLIRQGKGLFGSVNASAFPFNSVAIDTSDEGGAFFDTAGFMTAFINSDGKLQIVTWHVDATGDVVEKKGDAVYNAAVVDIAASASTVVARDSNKELRTIKWKINDDGSIAGYSRRVDGEVERVTATANLFTALQRGDGKLRVINWKITE